MKEGPALHPENLYSHWSPPQIVFSVLPDFKASQGGQEDTWKWSFDGGCQLLPKSAYSDPREWRQPGPCQGPCSEGFEVLGWAPYMA